MASCGTCSSNSAQANETREFLPPIDDSRLAGITFNNELGRYVSLYWQEETGRIVQSTYHQHPYKQWSLATVKAVTGSAEDQHRPKLCTPLTVVCLADGLKRWLFYLDKGNVIHELTTEDGGEAWNIGPLVGLKIVTPHNSCLNATVDYTPPIPNILINYQNDKNQIKRMVYDGGKKQWAPANCIGDSPPPVAPAGTSFATLTRYHQWGYFLDNNHKLAEYSFSPDLRGCNPVPSPFDPLSTISVCGTTKSYDPVTVFIRISTTAVKKVYWSNGGGWSATDMKNITNFGKHFIALQWVLDSPARTDIHLFSHIPTMRGYVLDSMCDPPALPQGPLPLRFECT